MIPIISDPNSGKVTWYRQGAEYENLAGTYIVDTKLMEVYQKHMK